MENLGNLPSVRARVHPLCQAVSLFAILPSHLHNLLPPGRQEFELRDVGPPDQGHRANRVAIVRGSDNSVWWEVGWQQQKGFWEEVYLAWVLTGVVK